MSDHCHCTRCEKCDRLDDHCRRPIVHATDSLCDECFKRAAEMFEGISSQALIGKFSDERPAPDKKNTDKHREGPLKVDPIVS